MTKPSKLFLAVAIGAILATVGTVYWDTHRYLETTDNAYVQADVSPVLSKVDGFVTQMSVVDNQVVKAGDVLVQVDDGDYETKVAQLQALVAARQAALDNLRDRVGLQHSQIARAQSDVTAAAAEQQRAAGDAQRFSDLLTQQYATKQRADAARADAVKAQAQLDASHAALTNEQGQTQALDALVEQAQAELKAAQAQVEQAQRDRANTRITAPVSGIVGKRSVQVGQLLRPGTTLLNIVQQDTLYVEANFKETQLARMHAKQPVRFTVDAAPGVEFTGVVDSLSPASGAKFSLLPQDNATGNFTKIVQRVPVKVRITGPQNYAQWLRPGLSAEVVVNTVGA